MGATRALTVAELVSQVPGVIPLKGGDYGTPQAAIGFGVGGGRVRVLWDGFEWLPLDGGIADLSRIGLGGIEEVRVERQSGELLIEIRSMEPNDREPVTMVDVGTGDLGTNVLRGVLAHPRTLGGALTFTLDRLETRGPGLDAAGSLSGVGLRYALARGNRGGLSAEVRRFATKTDVEDFPSNVTRSDWNLRGRWRFTDDLVGEAVWGASSLKGDADDSIFGDVDARRSQLGLRAGYERGGIWGDASARFLEGDGLPTGSFGLAMGASHPKALSLDASLRSQRWSEEDAKSWRARAVTAPLFGLSLFASYEDGRSGAPFVSAIRGVPPVSRAATCGYSGRGPRPRATGQRPAVGQAGDILHGANRDTSRGHVQVAESELVRSLALHGGGLHSPPRDSARSGWGDGRGRQAHGLRGLREPPIAHHRIPTRGGSPVVER